MGGAVAATSTDGGKTWALVKGDSPPAFRSAVSFGELHGEPRAIAVGPSGSDVSSDSGRTWKPLGEIGFHAADFHGSAGWAVGEAGRVAIYTGK
jgi:photosystem II stability/assembly factor-like uncharacterized protein